MSMQHFGRRWSYGAFRAGNGSKTFGAQFWYNGQRVAVQLNFHVWEIYLMREHS